MLATSKRSLLISVMVTLALTAAALWLNDRHYFAVRWPAQVQREVLGITVASGNDLVSKERSFAWGEGFARWRFKIHTVSPALVRLCAPVEVGKCSFNRTRQIEEGVLLVVHFDDNVLTIEDVWS